LPWVIQHAVDQLCWEWLPGEEGKVRGDDLDDIVIYRNGRLAATIVRGADGKPVITDLEASSRPQPDSGRSNNVVKPKAGRGPTRQI
jgi:hypothetical protein